MNEVQLLVSVRNADEARAAMAGGADIIDVKEPNHGSLGFAGWDVIQEISDQTRQQTGTKAVVSAALGELSDWLTEEPARIDLEFPRLHYAKIGLADQIPKQGTSVSVDVAETESDWIARWVCVRNQWKNINQWVAVAYSDHENCKAPAPEVVLDTAIETDCRVLLFDTFVKDGRTTFDHLDERTLRSLIQRSQSAGLKVAVAGQVTIEDTATVSRLQPDIVAVRGAVCENGDRKRNVNQQLVECLKTALQQSMEG